MNNLNYGVPDPGAFSLPFSGPIQLGQSGNGTSAVDPATMASWGVPPTPTVPMPALPGVTTSVPTATGAPALPSWTSPATDAGIADAPGNWLSNTFMTRGPDGGINGLNMDNLGSLARVIGGFGSLWSAFQQNRLAQDAFDFQKDAYQTNLQNQTQSYNTELQDRTFARFRQTGRGREAAKRYIDRHSLEF